MFNSKLFQQTILAWLMSAGKPASTSSHFRSFGSPKGCKGITTGFQNVWFVNAHSLIKPRNASRIMLLFKNPIRKILNLNFSNSISPAVWRLSTGRTALIAGWSLWDLLEISPKVPSDSKELWEDSALENVQKLLDPKILPRKKLFRLQAW